VLIVDYIRANLLHAKSLLSGQINQSVFLVHGDATSRAFPDESFNAVWTVQTFQHIPNFEQAVGEAYRVLKPKGVFSNYSLNVQPQLICRLLGKTYVTAGLVPGNFWLARASSIAKIKDIGNICKFGVRTMDRDSL